MNLNTQAESILFEGIGSYEKKGDIITLKYVEMDTNVDVEVDAKPHELVLRRFGELQSNLFFVEHKTTSNEINSQYGIVKVDLYTYRYVYNDTHLLVDYDVLSNGETTDSFQISFQIEEVKA